MELGRHESLLEEHILKLLYQQKLLRKQLEKEGEVLLNITGDSMQPLLKQGERIRVKKRTI